MSTDNLPPDSGFFSPQFWSSFLTVVCTFLLNQWGISSAWLQTLPGGDSWLPILVTVLICLYILISTFVQTRQARVAQSFPVSSKIAVKSRNLMQTSEFWLGLTVVAIKVLQETRVAGESISNSITTTFLILAIVYALSRSQLKQVYLKSLLLKVMQPSVVPFSPE